MITEIRLDAREFLDRIDPVYKAAAQKAAIRAANRTVKSVRSRIMKHLGKALGLKRKDLTVKLLYRNASRGNDFARLTILETKGPPLYLFAPKRTKVQTSRGERLGVTALQDGKRELVRGGFVAEMKSGHVGIFARKGEGRLPIRELHATKIHEYLRAQPGFMSEVQRFAFETYEKNFTADFEFFVAKGAG